MHFYYCLSGCFTQVQVPLPKAQQRLQILKVHLHGEPLDTSVTPDFLNNLANECEGFSGSDLFEICREAALRGLREWLNSAASTDKADHNSSQLVLYKKKIPTLMSISVSRGEEGGKRIAMEVLLKQPPPHRKQALSSCMA